MHVSCMCSGSILKEGAYWVKSWLSTLFWLGSLYLYILAKGGGAQMPYPLTLDIYILLIPTVYIHKSDWFFRNHFCFLSNTEWKKSVWQTTPKNEILKILTYSIFLIYMCPRLAVTACDHTGTPPHRPTFASKNDGRTPDFILGEWRQMIIH